MSDSDLPNTPPGSALEKSLRSELRKAAEISDDFTVKTVREASEKSLGLERGFYKAHETWNSRSKAVIKSELDNLEPVKDGPARQTPKCAKKEAPKQSKKRKSAAQQPKSRKRAKKEKEASESEELSSPPSHLDNASEPADSKSDVAKKSKKAKSNSKPRKQKQAPSKQEDSDADDVKLEEGDGPDQVNSDSEMSVVLDDGPPKQRNKKDNSKPKSTSSKFKTSTSKPSDDTDPDKEEIKKLQGWLVKCGVRKVWGKELKPYETSKAKIKHLKEMLSDVGMTGRFSNEKAASIKEARELAADIEAVQEGAERWGKSEEGSEVEGEGERTRSGRRLVRGAMNYDFLSSDGEETD